MIMKENLFCLYSFKSFGRIFCRYLPGAFLSVFLFLFLGMAQLPAAAQQAVNGRVTDNAGEPLAGVSVRVKSTSAGVSTDENGRYSINVPAGNPVLVFTYIG